ncbi:MAG: hypothetical protein P9M13_03410 [Candidatus Ancaeobacter aquaticus]|nr:hypothetical protein [Candidatus Ancaeobacter aquaticus]
MTEEKKEGVKTVLGVGENIEGLLCYFLTFVSAVFFLLVEKENKFVRFHAMQSLVTFVGISILVAITTIIPILIPIALIIMVVSTILWLVLMFAAFSGKKFKLPFIGEYCEKQIEK